MVCSNIAPIENLFTIIKVNQSFLFEGNLSFKVIEGQVEIFGLIFTKDDVWHQVQDNSFLQQLTNSTKPAIDKHRNSQLKKPAAIIAVK